MPERSPSGHVYVLRTNTTIDGEEIIKIGMTANSVEKRIRQLHTGSPIRMEVAYSLKVENARVFERELHLRFRAHRIQGGGGREFFKIPADEVIRHIEERAASISREKARGAFKAELAAFEHSIGIDRIRRRIGTACMGTALVVSVLVAGILCWIFHSGAGVFAFFPGLIFWIWLGIKMEETLEQRLIEIPFQRELRQIRAQLRRKYPLAQASVAGVRGEAKVAL